MRPYLKKIILTAGVSFFTFFVLLKPVLALSPESTSSSEFSDFEVRRLRDKIASQAARQRDTTRTVYFGNVSEKSAGGFLIKTRNGSKQINVLEQSKLVSVTLNARKSVELSSFITGSEVVVYGPINSEGSMTASWVLYFPKKNALLKREVLYGTITNLTPSRMSLKVRNGKVIIGSVRDTTVFSSLSGVTLNNESFSQGDTVVAVGYYDKDIFQVSGLSLVKQVTLTSASESGALR